MSRTGQPPHGAGCGLLSVAGLGVAYGDHVALRDVTFDVGPGELIAVIGPNGAGKSSMFRAIVGLVAHTGTVGLDGEHCHHQRDRMCAAYIPQRNDLDMGFPITVGELVLSGRRRFVPFGRRPGRADRDAAAACMERVGVGDLAARPIGTLSGGQAQRAFLARALAQEAHVLLLDEALSGVDQPRTEQLLDVFHALRADGVTMLVATHDLALARRRFDRCLAVNGRLVADGDPRRVLGARQLDAVFGSAVESAA